MSARRPSPWQGAALIVTLAISSGACLLIEQYGTPVPDAPDGGGGAPTGNTTSSTTVTGTTTATATTGTTSSTSTTATTGTTSTTSSSSTTGTTSSSGSTSSGTPLWAEQFGGALANSGNDVTTDGAGDIYLTGSFRGSIDFGKGPLTTAGNSEVFVARFDPSGAAVFGLAVDDASPSEGRAIAVDGTGSVLVAGNYQGSIDFGVTTLMAAGQTEVFLAKLDPTGATVWARGFGNGGQQQILGRGVAVDAMDDVIVAGEFEGSIDFGGVPINAAAPRDAFVAKLDPTGAPLWAHGFGTFGQQDAYAVAVSPSGLVGITGTMAGNVDFGNGAVPGAGGDDAFVAVFNAGGVLVWAKAYGDAQDQEGYGIAFDADDDVYVTGTFQGSIDFGGSPLTAVGPGPNLYVAKISPQGVGLASAAFSDGSAPGLTATSLAVDGAGNVLISGSIYGTLDFGGQVLTSAGATDALLLKLDPGLSPLFGQRCGDFNPQVANAIAADPMDDILATGAFQGELSLGGEELTSAGGADVFLVKLSP